MDHRLFSEFVNAKFLRGATWMKASKSVRKPKTFAEIKRTSSKEQLGKANPKLNNKRVLSKMGSDTDESEEATPNSKRLADLREKEWHSKHASNQGPPQGSSSSNQGTKNSKSAANGNKKQQQQQQQQQQQSSSGGSGGSGKTTTRSK